MTLISPTTRSRGPRLCSLVVPRAAPRQFGFTLVELTIVMAILAIVFFAVSPSFEGLVRGARQRAALREVVSLLTYARTEAVSRGRLVRVSCQPDEGIFWMEAQVDPQGNRSQFALLRVLGRSQVVVPDPMRVAGVIVSGRPVDPGTVEVYFYPDGRTDGLALTLADDTGKETLIELSSATGKVTLSA